MMEPTKIQILAICFGIFISGGYARPPKKILMGQDATITELPHQVSLQTPGGYHFCGGTIISSRYILTAAHCIVDDVSLKSSKGEIDVVTGTNDKLNRSAYNVFHVTRRVHHAEYSWSDSARHDIAIMKVHRPILFNEFQRAASLPIQDIPAHTAVICSGWGVSRFNYFLQATIKLPQYLQKMESSVIEQDECQNLLEDKIYPEHLCIVSERGAGPCDGDSGGPITHNNEVVGIISWSIGCGEGKPEVGVRVHKYRQWIQQVMSALTDDSGFISNSIIREVMPNSPSVVTV